MVSGETRQAFSKDGTSGMCEGLVRKYSSEEGTWYGWWRG